MFVLIHVVDGCVPIAAEVLHGLHDRSDSKGNRTGQAGNHAADALRFSLIVTFN